jgi:molybdopterin/thiamine biosynthesis adenylyltransferase
MGTISKEELIRYNRQMMLPGIGLAGQEKLKAAKVLVIGAGGLGCPLLLYLSAAGVGNIGIIDFDTVELHNLHRQVLYSGEDVGKAKAVIAAEKLEIKNPNTRFLVFNEMLDESNAEKIISQFEIVVDGSDNFMTRYLVNDTCVHLGIPLVYGSILRFEGQFAVFNHKGGKNLRDLFPEAPAPEDVPNCDETGILGSLAGIIASMMAQETLKMILGMNILKDQLLLLDSKDWNYHRLDY